MTKSSLRTGRKGVPPKKSTKPPGGTPPVSSKADGRYAIPLTHAQRRIYTKWARKIRSTKPGDPSSFDPSRDAFKRESLPLLEQDILGSLLFQEKCSEPVEGKKWASALSSAVGNRTFVYTDGKKNICALSGLRGTADIAAKLAMDDKNDNMAYCNYYCGGYEGYEDYVPSVLAEMKRMGWDSLPLRDLVSTVMTNIFILRKLRDDDGYAQRFTRTLQGTCWENEDSIFSKPEKLSADEASALVAFARSEAGAASQFKQTPLASIKDIIMYSDVQDDLAVTGYRPGYNLYPTVDTDENPQGKPEVSIMAGGWPAFLKLCEDLERAEQQAQAL